MIYPKGTKARCTSCLAHIFTTTRDAQSGDMITADLLTAIPPQKQPEKDEQVYCATCKNPVNITQMFERGAT